MNKIKLLFAVVSLISVFSLTSCDNEPIDSAIDLGSFSDDDGNNNGNGSVSFKADFSGNTWVADDYIAVVSGNIIRIAAGKGDQGEGFGFILDGTTAGTYQAKDNLVAFTPANSEYGYWAVNPDNENEDTGSVTITNINTTNHTISGFFNFKGYWSNTSVSNILPIVFNNGIFTNIPYTSQAGVPDSFFAKLNGSEYIETDILVATVNEVIGIGAAQGDTSITVGVDETLPVGIYTITGDVFNDEVQGTYKVGNTTYKAMSGSVTITSKTDTRIKGTFNFITEGTPPFIISEGTFDVEY